MSIIHITIHPYIHISIYNIYPYIRISIRACGSAVAGLGVSQFDILSKIGRHAGLHAGANHHCLQAAEAWQNPAGSRRSGCSKIGRLKIIGWWILSGSMTTYFYFILSQARHSHSPMTSAEHPWCTSCFENEKEALSRTRTRRNIVLRSNI